MKTILYSIAILLATLCWSCYDDKGNYDYTPFDNIVIEGISEQYQVQSFLDTLAIDVKVTPENADYEYLWTINTAYQEMPSMGDGFLPDTISTERTLNRVINYENGTYDLNLKVTDKNTGYAVHYNTTLVTQSAYSSGFYILKEKVDEIISKSKDENDSDVLISQSTDMALPAFPISKSQEEIEELTDKLLKTHAPSQIDILIHPVFLFVWLYTDLINHF